MPAVDSQVDGTLRLRLLDCASDASTVWPVVHELRPHLDAAALRQAWELQQAEGYLALGAFDADVCVGFAGYRLQSMLAHGRFLYVDDLVVRADRRGSGVGAAMLDWLLEAAQAAGCGSLQLDSGTQRTAAHAFYFSRGLLISSFHFRRALST
jgi:GNAT superfamily N-acetyltransferase